MEIDALKDWIRHVTIMVFIRPTEFGNKYWSNFAQTTKQKEQEKHDEKNAVNIFLIAI